MFEAIIALGLGVLLSGAAVTLALYVWTALALSKVFAKTGGTPWKAWVPVLNEMELLRISGVAPGWALGYYILQVVVSFGPLLALGASPDVLSGLVLAGNIISIIAGLLYLIVRGTAIHLINTDFGLSVGYTVLGVLLLPVWASVVGWGKAVYGGRPVAKADEKAGGFRLRDLGKIFGGAQSSGRQFGILGALVVIIVLFEILTEGKTLDPVNLINLVNGNAYVLVLAVGMVMVIVAGHIDLSVGSVAAFVGIVVAQSMYIWHWPWPVAMVLGLAVGALVGAWHGWWVAYVGVPAFIVTLAGMLFFRGANQFVGNSTSIPVPREFTFIGGGFLPDPDLGIPFNVPTLILGLVVAAAIVWQEFRLRGNQRKMGAESAPVWVSVVKVVVLVLVVFGATYLFASGRPGTSFPIAGIILGVLVLGYSFLTNNTTIGRHIYAVGGNWRAAELSGVNIRRVNFFVMANMSVIAAIAGMLWIARSVASGPGDGVGWELDAIAAVFIGGAAVSGGIGTIVGSIVGGLVIAVLNNGLQLLSVGADRVQMIKGLVLLVAVGIDVYSKRQGKPSIIGLLTQGRRTSVSATPVPAAPAGTQTPTPAGGAQETARPRDLTPEG